MARTKTRNKGQNGKNMYYIRRKCRTSEVFSSISQVLYRRGSNTIRTQHLKWRVLGSFSNDDGNGNENGKNAIARLV